MVTVINYVLEHESSACSIATVRCNGYCTREKTINFSPSLQNEKLCAQCSSFPDASESAIWLSFSAVCRQIMIFRDSCFHLKDEELRPAPNAETFSHVHMACDRFTSLSLSLALVKSSRNLWVASLWFHAWNWVSRILNSFLKQLSCEYLKDVKIICFTG